MRLTSKLMTVTAVAAVAAAVAMAPAAQADPSVTPAAIDIVSVGSDTIQVLDNQFSTDFNATAPASKYYSWNATGTSPITTKTGATSIARPNGSGAGITALNANTHTTVDIARSSRGPKTTAPADPTTDWFIAFAKDAVGWSGFTTVTGHTTHSPTTLSVTDLQNIYKCTSTKWNQITDIPGFTGSTATIRPYLPQTGSGTRSFFLTALGLTDLTIGSCVVTGPEENEGTNASFVNNVDAVFPYSVAHYVGQKYKGKSSGTDAPGALDALRSIKFSSTSTIAQVNTTAQTINVPFSATSFGRNVYHVVRSGDWNDATLGARLKKLLGTSAANGWICKNGAADITGYGFLTLPTAACGVITHT